MGRVDVWADAASGIPVLVEVFGRAGDLPAMSSTFLDFSDAAPATGGPGVHRRRPAPACGPWPAPTSSGTIARFGGPRPPETLLGFTRSRPGARAARRSASTATGVTQLVVSAVSAQLAGSLRDSLRLASGARELPEGLVVSVGPLGLLLTTSRGGTTWLVAGTVTADGLARAATELGAVAA